MREVICAGSEVQFNFLMTYWAHIFQRPEDKMSCAMVFRGKKGTCKSMLIEWIAELLFPYALKISQGAHVTGRFNKHMAEKLLMISEEAFFAKDPSHEGIMKDLISSDRIAIEEKFRDVVEVTNYMRLVFVSNEDIVVPVSLDDERRFGVLDVADHRRGHVPDYFKPLAAERHNGGVEGLMHALMTWTPPYKEKWDMLRTPPMSAGLRDQALGSMEPWDKFFYNLIVTGEGSYAFGSDMEDIKLNKSSITEIATKRLTNAFDLAMRSEGTHATRDKVGNQRFFGNKVMEWFSPEKKRGRVSNSRPWIYVIPPLTELKKRSEERLRFSLSPFIEWLEDEEY